MFKAALYIRVSTEDQAEYSPDAQKRLLLEYAQKNDLSVNEEHIFIDEGISGRKAEKRPAFMKMIVTAKQTPKPFDVILVHKFDRFSRSREDSIVYKSLLRKECNIRVISITEQIEDDKFSVILEAMLEAMAEYYSLNLADEVMKGMTEKALSGGYQSSPPLGYEIQHTREFPVIVPSEADIVKMIFHKYVHEQMSFYQIAKYLNSLGIKTKRNNDFERRSVEYIIKNPMYIGLIRWNRTHNATNTIKDESEWIVEKGHHEAIISEELFQKAQDRVNREQPGYKARPVTEYKHWLTGLIKCANCNRTMTASYHKKSKACIFQCSGYTKGKCPLSNSISENKLVPAILSALKNIILPTDVKYQLKEKENIDELFLLEQQLSKLSDKEVRIKNAYLSGVDSLEEYRLNKAYLLKEKNRLDSQLEILKYHLTESIQANMLKVTTTICEIIENDTINPIQKNQSLKSIIEKITYNKKTNVLDIYFKNTLLP